MLAQRPGELEERVDEYPDQQQDLAVGDFQLVRVRRNAQLQRAVLDIKFHQRIAGLEAHLT